MHFTSSNIPTSTEKANLKFVLRSNEYAPLCQMFKFCIIRKEHKQYISTSHITACKENIECNMTIKYNERHITYLILNHNSIKNRREIKEM